MRVAKVLSIVISIPIVILVYLLLFSPDWLQSNVIIGRMGDEIVTRLTERANPQRQEVIFSPRIATVSNRISKNDRVGNSLESLGVEMFLLSVTCVVVNSGEKSVSLNLFGDNICIETDAGARYAPINERRGLYSKGNVILPGAELIFAKIYSLPNAALSNNIYIGFPLKGRREGGLVSKVQVFSAKESPSSTQIRVGSYSSDVWNEDCYEALSNLSNNGYPVILLDEGNFWGISPMMEKEEAESMGLSFAVFPKNESSSFQGISKDRWGEIKKENENIEDYLVSGFGEDIYMPYPSKLTITTKKALAFMDNEKIYTVWATYPHDKFAEVKQRLIWRYGWSGREVEAEGNLGYSVYPCELVKSDQKESGKITLLRIGNGETLLSIVFSPTSSPRE